MPDKDIIPGIHNWCDRWCEKCSFIARCAVGVQELDLIEEEQKGNKPDFWEGINEQFTKSIQLIDELAKEKGIDLDDIPDEEWDKINKEREEKELEGENHPISKLAGKYPQDCQNILNDNFVKGKFDSEIQKLELELEKEAKTKIKELKEAVDIIRWYMFFIPAKSKRLMMENLDTEFEDAEFPPEERSYNGTAKITLIAIERSISSWGLLLQTYPEHQDEVLSVLALLQKLQKMIHTEFPDALSFIRPGFDE
ncbi:hypothetical protein [Marivirga sp.]|uniref:hypothetical protein n=1 Tax=Marivirga sp. TaxID=2018662 RepID=UPI003DA70F2A